MSQPLVADTGGLLRALARDRSGEPAWPAFEAALRGASLVVVPSLVLAEVDYFLARERAAMRTLVAEIFDPSTTYQFEPARPEDFIRALVLDHKFADLGLGLVDGLVAAVAERRGIFRLLTTDHADFVPLRVGQRFTRAFTLVP